MAYFILKSYKLKLEPYKIFEAFSRHRRCFFLDSSLNVKTGRLAAGRYSFLGAEPFLELESKVDPPFKKIKELLGRYKISASPAHPPFLGGAVGYLAYDSDLGIPACAFGFYNSAVIIDHWKKLLYIFSAGFPEKSGHLAKALAECNFKKLYKLVSRAAAFNNLSLPAEANVLPRNNTYCGCVSNSELKSNFEKHDYIAAVKKALDYIRIGDIYQVNLSQRFQARSFISGVEIYRRLRCISPSGFSSFLALRDFEILSSSPERFLRASGSKVITQPMKGTRPRANDKKRDGKLKKELLNSAKDKAELLMIVDLERNDLGRVCSYGSVEVSSPRVLEVYNTIYQTTATIEGELYKGKDRVDLLQACFPGGSITGCPKIRAMEIIRELEKVPRSIYTGSLGYLSFSGDMDFNILIRTILKKGSSLYFSSGGGIVADSDPEQEYEETLVKAKAMMEAIN